jgi:hypothetical protein
LIGETHDVIFTEIVADLNLLERAHAGLGQAMDAATLDVDRFVFMNGSDFRSNSDSSRAAHHDPIFRTVRRIAVNIAMLPELMWRST